MSLNNKALKGLVMQKLVVAADEIFALFEQTFAQYEEEFLRNKLMQQPRHVLYKEGIQSVSVAVNVASDQVINEEQVVIKQEEDPPFEPECPSETLKSEEPEQVDHSPDRTMGQTVDQTVDRNVDWTVDQTVDQTVEHCDGEEPGCSSDLTLDNNKEPCCCSDTDDSLEWDFLVEKATTNEAPEQAPSPVQDSAEVNFDQTMMTDGSYRELLHKCSLCDMSFRNIEALEVHHELHPGPFICQVCQLNFTHKWTYKQHLRTHHEPKPFKCPVCKHKFKQRYRLTEHMRIHTGEKPLSCSECNQKFRHRNSLMRHILTKHSDNQPYRCSVCERGFVQKWHFMAHMRGHTGEKPFSCSVCGQGFEIEYYLKRHIMRSHKADGQVGTELVF